jgi:hypothetical protein
MQRGLVMTFAASANKARDRAARSGMLENDSGAWSVAAARGASAALAARRTGWAHQAIVKLKPAMIAVRRILPASLSFPAPPRSVKRLAQASVQHPAEPHGEPLRTKRLGTGSAGARSQLFGVDSKRGIWQSQSKITG